MEDGLTQNVFSAGIDPCLVILGECVNEPIFPQVEIGIGRMAVKPGEMGTRVLNKARERQLLAACAAAHFVPSLEHGGLETCLCQIAGNDRRVVSTSNYHCIIFLIRHADLLDVYASSSSWWNRSGPLFGQR